MGLDTDKITQVVLDQKNIGILVLIDNGDKDEDQIVASIFTIVSIKHHSWIVNDLFRGLSFAAMGSDEKTETGHQKVEIMKKYISNGVVGILLTPRVKPGLCTEVCTKLYSELIKDLKWTAELQDLSALERVEQKNHIFTHHLCVFKAYSELCDITDNKHRNKRATFRNGKTTPDPSNLIYPDEDAKKLFDLSLTNLIIPGKKTCAVDGTALQEYWLLFIIEAKKLHYVAEESEN